MEAVRYNEWVPAGKLVKGLVAIVSVIIVFMTIAVLLLSKVTISDVFVAAFCWGTLVFILLVFWNYRGFRIQIKDDRLSLDYGFFNKKSFLLKEIASCKRTKAFGRYLGVGVRYGLDGSVAYTTSFANAVEITPRKGRTFVFSTKNPDKICEIITKAIA